MKFTLNQFLQQQQLKIEDIVQIIDFETRDIFFDQMLFLKLIILKIFQIK